MKTCKNCGTQYDEGFSSCPSCNFTETETETTNQNNNTPNKQQSSNEPTEKKMNGFGLVGMILGIISLFSLRTVGFTLSIVGIVFSSIGLARMKKRRLNGFAISGLVLNIVTLVFYLFALAALGAYLYS